ncbi:MAG: fibronectin type III domain-containing protein [Elusimicrobia bacterium]|nr:fibronectin type III domain-containing protein [Elusimicrobiota bacterium]
MRLLFRSKMHFHPSNSVLSKFTFGVILFLSILSLESFSRADSWDFAALPRSDSGSGFGPAMVVDSSGIPHISYEADSGKLIYLTKVGASFRESMVDSGLADYQGFSSIAVDAAGRPRISYHRETPNELRFASWTGSGWSIETVDRSTDMGKYNSLAIDSMGWPHISYYDGARGDLKYASWNGVEWSTETVDSNGDTGRYSSLALDASDKPRIAYFDVTNGHLKYATWSGISWSTSTIDSNVNTGKLASLVIDSSGRSRIAYTQGGWPYVESLRYANWDGTRWLFQTVLTANDLDSVSLRLDASNNPRICTHETFAGTKFSQWTGSNWATRLLYGGVWSRQAAMGLDSSGMAQVIIGPYSNFLKQSPTPDVPKDLARVGTTANSLTWKWTDAASDETGYRVRNSSSGADLSGPLAPNTTYWVQSLLVPNTPSQVYVEVFNSSGSRSSAISPLAYTLALPPSNSMLTNVYSSSVTLSWSSNTNTSNTTYVAEKSLDNISFTPFATGTSLSVVGTGLFAETTYYFRVRSRNGDYVTTDYDSVVTTMTNAGPPLAPGKPTSIVQSGNSLVWTWLDNANNEDGFQVLRTSDGFNLSGNLPAGTTSWTQINLTPNTSQNITVQAFNGYGTSISAASGNIYSAANAPTSTSFTGVYETSVTFSWNTNENPPGTYFYAEWSLNNVDFSMFSSGKSSSVVASALLPETTYYFRVRAVNGSSLFTPYDVTISTLTMLASPRELTVSNSSINSLTWGWLDKSSKELGYRVLRKIDNKNISGDLLPNTTFWIQNALEPNSAQNVYVQAFDSLGTSNSSSSGVHYTLANPPNNTAFTGVFGTSVTLSWSANGNPDGTYYDAFRSTDNAVFTQFVFSDASTSAVALGLAPETPYYFRIRAKNFDYVSTIFDTTVSTYTKSSPPIGPTGLTVSEQTVNSIVWRWNDNSRNEQGFRVLRSSDKENLSGELPANTTFWIQTEFRPNAIQNVFVQAFNDIGTANSSPFGIYTLPKQPTGTSISVFKSSITLTWSANGNPDGTYYDAFRSTDNITFTRFLNRGISTKAVFSGVSPDTTFYFRVRAQNFDLIPTAFDSAISTYIPASPVLIPAFSFERIKRSTDTIIWSWGDVSNELGYRIIRVRDGVNISGDLPPNTTYWTQSGLLPSTTYQIQIEAFNSLGSTRTSLSFSDKQVSTLANPPKGLKVTGLSRSGVSIAWLANNNPEWAIYELQISNDGASYTVFSDKLRAISTSINTLLPKTTYYFRIRAMSQDGLSTEFDTPLMVTTPNSMDSNGGVILETTSHGTIFLNIPPRAFSSAVELNVQTPLSFPNPNSPGYHLLPTGAGIDIGVSPRVQPALPISITFSYMDEDIRDFDESKLVLARFIPDRNIWVPLPGNVNASTNKITATTDNLSLFQVMMLAPGNSVNECKAFPNPLRPGQPGNEVLKFTSLPMGAKLTIYTMRGERVWERTADDQGNISWDAQNDNGESVASGVYLVFLDGDGGKKTIKVAVQR